MAESGSATKRHNPVDSICRKIKTIQMRDQDSNPNLQIPKFQSRNFDSPQSSTKKNLEEVLKNRTVKNTERDLVCFSSPCVNNTFSPNPQVSSPCPPRHAPDSDSPLGNATYSVNTVSKDKVAKVWPSCRSQSCSTPMVFPRDLPFKFPHSALPVPEGRSLFVDDRVLPAPHSFYFTDRRSDHFPLQSPVVKRLSMSEAGLRRAMEAKTETASEVSLICEEDLLNSIFHACDTDHRGKVAVSRIVDYLRHTTSRGSEDSGLDELCNMLDPERRDISMDLDTYHAIMKEWIDDCRNNGADSKCKDSVLGVEDSMFKLRESLLAVRRISGTMNVTSGSLEAFGGDVSRGDLETSDLITCVADLQYNNQKLQEQHHKLKTTVENLEEANHRLLEENEELRSQWKSVQQSVTRARALKDELEEMKVSASASEERKAQMASQNKQLEKENLSLVHKISSLQEENMRNVLEAEGLRKTIAEVSDKVAVLQLQLNDSENAAQKKEAALRMKDLYVEELRSTLVEYSTVIENLRIEKTKLENSLQQMEQELLSNGIASPLTCKFNRLMSGGLTSLHSELELAQQSPEISGAEWMFSSAGNTSSLDVTLDREVLLLLQGPGQEQVGAEYKSILQTLQEDSCAMADLVLVSLQRLMDSGVEVTDLPGKMLEMIKSDLREKRNVWSRSLKQLERQKESLDKEFVKMASNLRRAKTEHLHLRKELSARLHELETVRQQQEDAEGRACAALSRLRDSSAKEEASGKKIGELEAALRSALAEADSARSALEEAVGKQRELSVEKAALSAEQQAIREKSDVQQKTINSLQEKLFRGQLCGLLCQTCSERDEESDSAVNDPERATRGEEKSCFSKRFGIQETGRLSGAHKPARHRGPVCVYTPLLDALTLEILQLYPGRRAHNYPRDPSKRPEPGRPATSRGALLNLNKGRSVSLGVQTDAADFGVPAMDVGRPEERVSGQQAEGEDLGCRSDLNSPPATDGPSPSPERTLLPAEQDPEPGVMEERGAASVDVAETSSSSGQSMPGGGSTEGPVPPPGAGPGRENAGGCSPGGPEEKIGGPRGSTPSKGSPPAVSQSGSQNAAFEENRGSDGEKAMETEFLRLSLGFKCDLFTLEKRLRLEERSRDLAEENLKKEIAGCVKLLEALTPLCEEDNQTHEVVKKLEKSLQFLGQHSARVACRAEMLGAIHQESRVSKAVDVMIQHVENLKRMYAKEHAELEELRELIQQNEPPRLSAERDDLHKLPTSLIAKPAARRVSMPTYTRGLGTSPPLDPFGSEKLDGKLHKRSNSWKLVGTKQTTNTSPILQRFVANYTRSDPAEENFIKEDEAVAEPLEETKERIKPHAVDRGSSPAEPCSTYRKLHFWASNTRLFLSSVSRPVLISVLAVLLLVVLLGFLTGLSFQRPADGEPVGPGDSWTAIQQFFWPYAGLHHNGQPPV
ncbi:inositol 1,4,5-triphosphate receptor associated 2 [Spea bombifrons]|uniref:inositol 1,4,5-triphosphate receptor associated 2 n=1 Tax=Spea bombifrons TaxID=233779 RepID=UPI00234B2FF3|nr:inositol 1,4,5-triphosphate receptor associated 2 [Spea bombifrons]